MDKKLFFEQVRSTIFGKVLTGPQVSGIECILSAFDKLDLRFAAYALATAYHETDRTMQPIREKGGNAYFTRLYDLTGERRALALEMGNTKPGDGIRYSGRGFVQLTWKVNYQKASKELLLDLVGNPDLAMQEAVAARIMLFGMIEGWFTGKKLSDYFRAGKSDWKGARKIINGTDKDDEIAAIARKFYGALIAAQTVDPPTPKGKPIEKQTTTIAATVTGGAVVIQTAREAIKPIQDATEAGKSLTEALTGFMSLPTVALCVIGLAALAWIVRERLIKAKEYGV